MLEWGNAQAMLVEYVVGRQAQASAVGGLHVSAGLQWTVLVVSMLVGRFVSSWRRCRQRDSGVTSATLGFAGVQLVSNPRD